MSVTVASLLVALALALGAVAVLAVLLVRERRRYAELFDSIQRRPESGMLHGAQAAVQLAVQTASRLRHQGVGGMLMGSLDDLARWASEDRAQLVRVAGADGTITFMFTDIENSTALNDRLGDAAWVRVLEAHNRVVRSRVAARQGHIVKSQGDGFMLAFSEAEQAVAAAVDIQRALAGRRRARLRTTEVAVRIGIHRGSAVSRDGDYFGRAVATAARIAAQAGGGEILVSEATLQALPDPEQFATGEPRSASLKGLAGEVTLYPIDAG